MSAPVAPYFTKAKLCLLCFFFVCGAQASDTLTRAQVYNFNVGDTFEYLETSYSDANIQWNDTFYNRTVITGKFYSLHNDTLFYTTSVLNAPCYDVINNCFFNGNDTLMIDSLQLGAVVYQKDVWACNCDQDTNAFSDSISNVQTFDGRQVNKIMNGGLDHGAEEFFASGLGSIFLSTLVGNNVDGMQVNTSQLIYFSQLGATWGTPHNIVSGVTDLNASQTDIQLYPNPANDLAIVNYGFTDYNQGAVSMEISNSLGKLVYTQPLPMYSTLQQIDVSNYAVGIYTVYIKRANQIVAANKLVVVH